MRVEISRKPKHASAYATLSLLGNVYDGKKMYSVLVGIRSSTLPGESTIVTEKC